MKKVLGILMVLSFVVFGHTDIKAQEKAPKTKLANIKGGKKTLKDFKGKIVYVDFWASWCAPCYSAMPSLVTLKQEFGDNIEIVTVSLDDSKKKWKKAYKKARPVGTALWGGKAGSKSKIAKELGIFAMPQYVIIDQNGRIVNSAAPGPYQAKATIRELIRRAGK